MNQIMMPHTPEPVEIQSEQGVSEFEKEKDSLDRLNAVILTSRAGTQVSEFLISYSVLSESGLFNVHVVSDQTDPIPLTGGLSVYPELGFDEVPKADLIVIPSLLDTQEAALLNYLRTTIDVTPLIVTLGEGIQILGEMGFLTDFAVTSHPLSIDSFQSQFKQLKFQPGYLWLEDRNLISSSGVASSLPAQFAAIAHLFGWDQVNSIFKKQTSYLMNLKTPEPSPLIKSLDSFELTHLFLRAAFLWEKQAYGIYLYPGVSEIGLAALTDLLPRTLAHRTVHVAEQRQPVLTRHGLRLLPSIAVENSPTLDLMLVPHGPQKTKTHAYYLPLQSSPKTTEFLNETNTPVKSFQNQPETLAYEHSLDFIARTEGQRVSQMISQLVIYPQWEGETQATPLRVSLFSLILRAIAIGLVGLLIAFTFERRMRRRKAYDTVGQIGTT